MVESLSNLPLIPKVLESLILPTHRLKGISNWLLLANTLSDEGITDEYNLAGVAATVLVETTREFEPIEEFGQIGYFVRSYWRDSKVRKSLGNIQESDSYAYKGRGFIQITGRANYGQAQLALGVPLLDHPELALEPETSARILLWYWKKKKLDLLCPQADTQNKQNQLLVWQTCRRRVNGGLNGFDDFLRYLQAFEVA